MPQKFLSDFSNSVGFIKWKVFIENYLKDSIFSFHINMNPPTENSITNIRITNSMCISPYSLIVINKSFVGLKYAARKVKSKKNCIDSEIQYPTIIINLLPAIFLNLLPPMYFLYDVLCSLYTKLYGDLHSWLLGDKILKGVLSLHTQDILFHLLPHMGNAFENSFYPHK